MSHTTHGETPRARGGSGPDPSAAGLPSAFGRYRVVRVLGVGGMGSVYLAMDDTLGREVAIKTVRSMGALDDTSRQRFLNEAKAVAGLDHAHIVAVYDLGIEGETPYIVMELVRGRSLAEILGERGRLPANEVCTIGIQIARALARAHELGIVHRDVKPANILEAGPGMWKLADFGVARLPDSSLTMTGIFIGTPGYGAPEALTAGTFTSACDVFSLGALLYECLTGGWAQKGKDVLRAAVAFEMADLEPPSRHAKGVSPALDAALLAAVSRDPTARPSAAQLADALAGAGAQVSAPLASGQFAAALAPAASPRAMSPGVDAAQERRKWMWLAIGAAVLLLLGVLLGQMGGGGGKDDPEGRPVSSGGEKPGKPAPGTGLPGGAVGSPTGGLFDQPADEPPWPDANEVAMSGGNRAATMRRGKSKGKGGGGDPMKRWRKAEEKYYEGKLDEAAREVFRIYDDDPGNEAAARWLRWYEERASEIPPELQGDDEWDD